MTRPSTPLLIRLSGESAPSAPTRSATALVTEGTASVTTRESTAGSWDRVSAWNEPILPRPIRPRRMVLSLIRSGGATMATGRRSVEAADDVLVPVDHRSGDHAAAVGE